MARDTASGEEDAPAIPAGAKWLKDDSGSAKVNTEHGLLDVDVRELKAADPMAQGIMTLKHGRFPAGGHAHSGGAEAKPY